MEALLIRFTQCIAKATRMLLLSFCCLSLASCVWTKSTSKRIAENRDTISANFQKELKNQQFNINQEYLNVSWQSALNKMYLSNPELIQADHRIEDAKQRQRQIWINMIPGLSAGVDTSFQIGEIGDAFANPVYRINSFLNLGDLLRLPKTVYTRKLSYIGSELQAENTMRQQVIALYRLFQQQRLLDLEKRALNLEGQLLKGITGAEGPEIIDMQAQHREALENWKENYDDWKIQVGDFFMSGYSKISLQSKDLPDITYNPSQLNFSDTKRWGMLQLNLLALEEIADKGNFLDAYLRYFPRANLTVSAPPLYSSNNSQPFRASDIRLGPSLSWNLDSRGDIRKQIKRLERESPIKQWRKDRRQRNEIRKLLEGKKALREIQNELVSLRQAIKGYQEAVQQGLITNLDIAIRTLRGLREREVRLLAKEIEICSSFWLIDESRWRPITKRWLATRQDRANIRNKINKKKRKGLFNLW